MPRSIWPTNRISGVESCLAICTPASAFDAPAARDHADAGFAGQLAVRVGHHRGAAFLAADRDLDVGVVQAVQHRQVAFARHAENVFDALGDQLVYQDVTAETGCLLGHRGIVAMSRE